MVSILALLLFGIFVNFHQATTADSWLTSQQQHPKELAAKYYRAAVRAHQAGKINKAIRLLKKAIDLDKANDNYINKLAKIYHEQEKFKQALRYLTKSREIIQDSLIQQAVQMMNWEGFYALSNGLRKEAIRRFELAAHTMDTYGLTDSLLKSSIHCNWGVAEMYDQAWNSPCDTVLLGEHYPIHITDVNRAVKRFQTSWELHPDSCNQETRWNLALVKQIQAVPKDTLTKYYGYIPKDWVRQIAISHQDTFCPLSAPIITEDSGEVALDLSAFKDVPKYKEVLFVLDISGSMDFPVSSKQQTTRFSLMRRLIEREIEAADSTQKIGMLTIGGNCPTTPLVNIPVDTGNRQLLLQTLNGLRPDGKTPLYSTLEVSPQYFSNKKNEKIILLASDGIESCRSYASVCQLAEELCNQGIKIEVFSLLLDERANYSAYGLYQCMSDACRTEFTGLNEEGGVDDKTVKRPVGNFSLIVDREQVLTGIYEAPQRYFK
ncbi:MAG: VWA domain-containing protein [Bacteroidota bacterium]